MKEHICSGQVSFPSSVSDPTSACLQERRGSALHCGAVNGLLLCPGGSQALVAVAKSRVFR